MKKRINKSLVPGRHSMLLLKTGLPIITAALLALTLKFHKEAEIKPMISIITYPEMFSQILSSLLVLVITAMIFDFAEKRKPPMK